MGKLLEQMEDGGLVLDMYLNCRTASCFLLLSRFVFAMFLREKTLVGLRISMHEVTARRPGDR
jgi:hypothetical protein